MFNLCLLHGYWELTLVFIHYLKKITHYLIYMICHATYLIYQWLVATKERNI